MLNVPCNLCFSHFFSGSKTPAHRRLRPLSNQLPEGNRVAVIDCLPPGGVLQLLGASFSTFVGFDRRYFKKKSRSARGREVVNERSWNQLVCASHFYLSPICIQLELYACSNFAPLTSPTYPNSSYTQMTVFHRRAPWSDRPGT